ncbi:MAG: 50S ribosomal protein L24 [Pseudomonadales bacterium]|nr:50S ribosomal protein L24 [Pseudomonadales bacterium]
MKFKVGDTVKVTSGKDKGKVAQIVRVLPSKDAVVVEGVNMYVKHVKPYGGRSGDKVTVERPLPTAKVAIVNDKGEVDRIGMSVAKDGSKTRVFKKSGAAVPEPKTEAKK